MRGLLMVETVVPITLGRHGKWSMEKGTDFSYCKAINACPLMVSEFRAAAATLPESMRRKLRRSVPFGSRGRARR